MMLSVSGLEIMNFEYSIDTSSPSSLQHSHMYQMLRCLLRDTMVESFQRGFLTQEYSHHQNYLQEHSNLRELIEVCLILSMQFQT